MWWCSGIYPAAVLLRWLLKSMRKLGVNLIIQFWDVRKSLNKCNKDIRAEDIGKLGSRSAPSTLAYSKTQKINGSERKILNPAATKLVTTHICRHIIMIYFASRSGRIYNVRKRLWWPLKTNQRDWKRYHSEQHKTGTQRASGCTERAYHGNNSLGVASFLLNAASFLKEGVE